MGGDGIERGLQAGVLDVQRTGNSADGYERVGVASGNLLADFRANAAAEAQGRLQTARLYHMTDDNGVRNMLRFNLARDTLHQNLWLKAIEELQADGLVTTVAPNALFEEEYAEHATADLAPVRRRLRPGRSWASGPQPDGRHEFGYLADPKPLGEVASAPAPDPSLYATYDGALGEPGGPALHRSRPRRKDQGRSHLTASRGRPAWHGGPGTRPGPRSAPGSQRTGAPVPELEPSWLAAFPHRRPAATGRLPLSRPAADPYDRATALGHADSFRP